MRSLAWKRVCVSAVFDERYLSNTRKSVSSEDPNTEKSFETTTRSRVVLTPLRSVLIRHETLKRVFDMASQTDQKIRRKRTNKIAKLYAN